MDCAYLPYLVTELFCIIFTATIFSRLQSEVGDKQELTSLKRMVAAYLIMLAADMLWTFVENGPLRMWHMLNAVSNGISTAAVALGCYFWFQFMEHRLGLGTDRGETSRRLIRIPLVVICILDLGSALTGWVFYISPEGLYTEGKLFWLQGVVTFAYLLVPTVQSVYCAFKTSHPQKRREYLTYVLYICICFAAVAVGDYVPTVPLFALSIFAVIQVLFLTLYLDHEYELSKKERELAEFHMAVMLSQLQPHFLFNALMAIQDLCHGRAPEAEQAVVEFAEYLRGNINSLRYSEPIPFAQELEHTKNYLRLESRRFINKIHVEYDIRTESFSIPVLTLQPIVENAVRYGITQRVEGGSIRISAAEAESAYVVTVCDDGVGFDVHNPKPDGRSHIGIKSVRGRLAEMCGGSLEVVSKPGEGTTVVITIPKKGESAHENPDRRR